MSKNLKKNKNQSKNANNDVLDVLEWFRAEVKHGKPCEICFECRISILDDVNPIPHQNHLKLQWNAGHDPLRSKNTMEFTNYILKLYKR